MRECVWLFKKRDILQEIMIYNEGIVFDYLKKGHFICL